MPLSHVIYLMAPESHQQQDPRPQVSAAVELISQETLAHSPAGQRAWAGLTFGHQ